LFDRTGNLADAWRDGSEEDALDRADQGPLGSLPRRFRDQLAGALKKCS
jgi:hypothetical protein